MIEMHPDEYLNSTVEDGELIAVLSFYDHLPAPEAIALKDMLLYDRYSRNSAPIFQRGPVLGVRDRIAAWISKDQGREA